MLAISTIGEFLDHGYELRVCCARCHHMTGRSHAVDLPKMAERFGRDHDLYVDHFGPRRPLPMRCGRCGSRQVSWIVSAMTRAYSMATWGAMPSAHRMGGKSMRLQQFPSRNCHFRMRAEEYDPRCHMA
jgi:hypothetical protein